MSAIRSSASDLNAIDAVQDLSHDSAATIQGGAVEFYTHANFQGDVGYFDSGEDGSNLLAVAGGRFHDSISSIINNTDRTLIVCANVNYSGEYKSVRPGQYISFIGHQFNDKISSFFFV